MKIKKILVVSIIILFISIAVAPSINQSVVTASQEDDLVEVTTQACGIQGYRDTTVKLTRQQYQDLEQYLVEFRARLNQTTTREEAIPIFKEAVVELDRYGLLPRGMSVEKAQRLVTKEFQNQRFINFLSGLCNEKQYLINSNILCLVAGESDFTYVVRLLYNWFIYGGFWFFFISYPWPWAAIGFFLAVVGVMLQIIADRSPIALIDVFGIGCYYSPNDEILYGSGWIKSAGLLGVKSWNGSLRGNLPGLKIPYFELYISVYPAMWGFCGIKIMLDDDGCHKFFIGTALALSIDCK